MPAVEYVASGLAHRADSSSLSTSPKLLSAPVSVTVSTGRDVYCVAVSRLAMYPITNPKNPSYLQVQLYYTV